MRLIIVFILLPLIAFAQYNPVDANTKFFLKYWAGVETTNDSVDVWNDQSPSGLNPAQSTSGYRPVLGTDGITFDGSDDRLQVGSPGVVRPGTGDFTIDGRIYLANYGTQNTIYSLFSSSTQRCDLYIASDNKLGIYCHITAGNIAVATSENNTLINGSTHTFSIVVDRDVGVDVYIDGTEVTASGDDANERDFGQIGSNLHIGRYGGGASYFSGRIDALRYSNIARTESEVIQFYNWVNDTTYYDVVGHKNQFPILSEWSTFPEN
jgi:hypothetical protein